MVSEAEKCYLCDLLGDFEEFKDIKKQFDDQHECWKQNELKKENNSKTKQNDQIVKSFHNTIIPNEENEVTDERTKFKNPKNISKQQKSVQNEILHEGKSNLQASVGSFLEQKRPFKCELCDKDFRHYNSLSCHMQTHTGSKPFKCQICEKQFTASSTLSKHISTQHH